jgi:hypothetical protein
MTDVTPFIPLWDGPRRVVGGGMSRAGAESRTAGLRLQRHFHIEVAGQEGPGVGGFVDQLGD